LESQQAGSSCTVVGYNGVALGELQREEARMSSNEEQALQAVRKIYLRRFRLAVRETIRNGCVSHYPGMLKDIDNGLDSLMDRTSKDAEVEHLLDQFGERMADLARKQTLWEQQEYLLRLAESNDAPPALQALARAGLEERIDSAPGDGAGQANGSDAAAKTGAQPRASKRARPSAPQKRARGRRPQKLERAIEAMKKEDPKTLDQMLEKEMVDKWGTIAKRTSLREARKVVLSRNGDK
jgi:hypothetical protein